MHQNQSSEVHPPWYRQFWPWVLIAIPLLTVIASGVTFWLALSHPDSLVVDDVEYQQIRNELKAQDIGTDNPPNSDSRSDSEEDNGQP